ncbi:MAG: hypothetical protein ACREQ7_09405 [Candidatus Binatia bacterium]
MEDYAITLACRNYDGTNAILRGLVRPKGVELRVIEENDVPKMFTGMFRGEYDVSEMSLAELIYYQSRDQCDFIGIPVFPSRIFRHSYILCNASSGITSGESLNGKKIGCLRWVQTAHVWVRGMLVEEYGISSENTRWYVWDVHHWQGANVNVEPRDGSVIHRLQWSGRNEYESSCAALLEGGLDVLITTENLKYAALLEDNRVKRLFEDFPEVEAAYYRKTKIFPIMHTLVVRKSVAERHPDLPAQLFELFSQSKKIGQESILAIPSLSMAWKTHYLEMERKIFERDPWAYGLEKNKHIIAKFLSYCHEQGVSARRLGPEELFVPSTWNLSE